MAQHIDSKQFIGDRPVSVVVAPCSAAKSKLPHPDLAAASLVGRSQAAAQAQWSRALTRSNAASHIAARDLYKGRSVRILMQAAQRVSSDFFVISAGLGLIHQADAVPAYDVTVSPGGASSLPGLLTGRWDAGAWWRALQAGPFARPVEALCQGEGRILMALSRPYAQMLNEQLLKLPPFVLRRSRIFGAGIERHLPEAMVSQVIRYDARLNAITPGLGLDFPARALAHFVRLPLAEDVTDVAVDQHMVEASLGSMSVPAKVKRERLADEDLLPHLRRFAADGLSIGKALARLRDEVQVACEQHRFRRLYEEVLV